MRRSGVHLARSSQQWLNYHSMRFPVTPRIGFSVADTRIRCNISHLLRLPLATLNMTHNAKLHRVITNGGHFVPKCLPLQRVAIIVPYRNRTEHLEQFVPKMHRFLVFQNVSEYRLYILEQADKKKFNRAKLFNVGYSIVRRHWRPDVDCFIFHDVELVPLNPGNLYLCASQPRHMSSNIRHFLNYENCFGGASALTGEQLERINGFSNEFFGWGGEDDEVKGRLVRASYTVVRLPAVLATYAKLHHKEKSESDFASGRLRLIDRSAATSHKDGLNSLHFEMVSLQEMPLYTLIRVKL